MENKLDEGIQEVEGQIVTMEFTSLSVTTVRSKGKARH